MNLLALRTVNIKVDFGSLRELGGHLLNGVDVTALPGRWHLLAYAAVQRGDMPTAIGDYREAVMADPSDRASHYQLGELYSSSGSTDAAIREYRAANAGQVFFWRAVSAWGEGDVATSEAQMSLAAQISSEDGGMRGALGSLYWETGRQTSGLQDYKQALQLSPCRAEVVRPAGDPNCLVAQARTAAKEQHWDLSIAAYQALLVRGQKGLGYATFVSQTELLIELASAWQTGKGDQAEAERGLRTALQTQNHNASFLLADGTYHLQHGEKDEAVALVQQASRVAPTNPQPEVWLGQFALGQGQLAQADLHFQEALRRDSNLATAYSGLGMVAVARKDFVAALPFLKRAVALSPTQPAYHLQLADALYALGNGCAAKGEYQRSSQLDTGNVYVQQKLVELSKVSACSLGLPE